jgi:4-amino-4-deoxy-L-arabinose transferase-like glycosyltransferase
MNCLESGNYALLTIAVVLAFLPAGSTASREWPWRRVLATGVLLGVTFWTRNDAVFLILAACLVYITRAGRFSVAEMRARLSRTLAMGFTSIAVALPWLLHNQANFGSIMPISGQAESNSATFGSNLDLVSSMVLEYVSIFVQIPNTIQGTLFVEVGSLLVLALVAVALRRHFKRASDDERSAIFMIVVFGGCLVAFYGLWFGAPHFISRYFFPMSPVLAILSMQGLFGAWRFLRERREAMATPFAIGVSVIATVLLVGLNVRNHQRSIHQMHFQAVEWIAKNVPEKTWIGAAQTGTIGFFHDRTVNLDGKVNPEALKHVVADTIPQYVVDKGLQYIVDWFGLADHWITARPLETNFEIIVNDQERNLSVMRRKGSGK